MLIKEAIKKIQVELNLTKYAVAKKLDVQPIMIDNYLSKTKTYPQWRVCKAMYENFNLVIEPYTEDELKNPNEQTLMKI
jgi:predicted transcriptional regulator